MNEQEILLKQTFHEEMLGFYKRVVKELKYKSPRLLEMMNKYGGYEAAIKMLPTDAHTFDFTLLWEQERLDLSIEALVTKERYKNLFPADVITFCQRRLDEYNYAPKKLKEEDPALDDFVNDLFDFGDAPSNEIAPSKHVPKPDADLLEQKVTTKEWESLFVTPSIFTEKNQDLIIKMYALGSKYITCEKLGAQEGYTIKYPFYEVIMTLAKRIKSALKLTVPIDPSGKPIWWQILFVGMYHSNQDFSWSLRDELKVALTHLMENGTIAKVEALEVEAEEESPSVAESTPLVEPEPVDLSTTIITPEPLLDSTSDVALATKIPSDFIDTDESSSVISTQSRTEPTPEVAPSPIAESTPEVEDLIEVAEPLEVSTDEAWQALKVECLDYYGAVCDLCGFDFGYTYGEAFENFIKVHTLKPYSKETLHTLDPHKDLVPICCNCDAVIHSKVPAYTIDKVKEMLAKAQKDVD